MTYEENLRKTAEWFSDLWLNTPYEKVRGPYRKDIKQAAEYCLKKQSEAYSVAYNQVMQNEISLSWNDQAEIEAHLKQLGLIP